MTQKRPIDVLRDSALSGKIGSDGDDSAITDMIPIGDRLYFVKQRAIYAMQLADQIDPERTNATIPHTQQQILAVGSSDPIVARTLLTAHGLFDKKFLGPSFDQEKGLKLALELLKDISAIGDMRADLEVAETRARTSFESEKLGGGTLRLPAIGNLKARCDAFAQKAGHVVKTLEEVAKLFYGKELTKKWIDSLATLAAQRYGQNSRFAQYLKDARPFLLLVLSMRNMIEHPTANKHIKVFDFRLLPSGQIALPSVEIVRPDEETATATVVLLMKNVADDLVSVIEVLIAYLCSVNVQPFAGMPIQVVELPVEQRPNEHQRLFYACQHGGQIVRIG